MSGKTILEEAILVSQTTEALAQQLIAKSKYPTSFLSEIETPMSIQAMAEAI